MKPPDHQLPFSFVRFVCSLVLLLPGSLLAQQARKAAASREFRIEITTNHAGGRYAVGEPATFSIRAFDGTHPLDTGSVDCSLSADGYSVLESSTLGITGRPLEMRGLLEKPGFLRCEVILHGAGEKELAKGVVAAAYAPEEIPPSRFVPPDFDAFWEEQRDRLAEVPLEAELRPMTKGGNEKADVFDLRAKCLGGAPVSGYLARPKRAGARSLPAVIWTHGAGVRGASLEQALLGAREGFLSLDLNAHGIANGQPEAFYKELELGPLQGYPAQGRENRDGSYFRGMYLRLIRAVDFMVAQPEWDGKTLAVVGHSQGGGQALAAGGLDPRVTFIAAGVPAMCDHTGMIRRRISGWPKLVPLLPDGKAEPIVAEVSRYFDAVNLATRCQAEALLSVGWIDSTCPPTSVYAAYNQLRGSKQMLDRPAMGHAAPPDIQTAFLEALKRHAARTEASTLPVGPKKNPPTLLKIKTSKPKV